MVKNKKIMGDNIQYYMDKKGVDRHQLAKALKIPYSSLTDWINGRSYPRIDKIEMLAKYFNISKSALVESRFNKGLDEDQLMFPPLLPHQMTLAEYNRLHPQYNEDELLFFLEKYIEKNYNNISGINIEIYANALFQHIKNQCLTYDQISKQQKQTESDLLDRIEKLEKIMYKNTKESNDENNEN